MTLIRVDLQFAVNFVCQKMHAPTVSDYTLIKRIIRYIKGTITMDIPFNKDIDCLLKAYSDSDLTGCKITRCSTGGYCTFLDNNIISWSSKKHHIVAKSSIEAEYLSLSETASEMTWVGNVLRELGISLPLTPELQCDNMSAVYLTANPAYHVRTKHFGVHHHYVRERVALKTLIVKHIPDHLQLADIFIKSVPIAPQVQTRC